MFPFELTRPWLLLALFPLTAVIAWYHWRSLSDFPTLQRRVSLVIRFIMLLWLVLSLAGLTWLDETDEQCVVFLQDTSLSIGEDGAKQAQEFLESAAEAKGANRAILLPFASQSRVPRELKEALSKATSSSPTPDTEDQRRMLQGTNLASAIEAAAGTMPPGYVPKIVVLSDGNQTAGDGIAAAARSHVSVSTVTLPTKSDPEVQVAEVNVPAEVREGEPFFVNVVIQSNHEDEGLVEIFRGDHKVISEKQKFKAGVNELRFQQSIERDRLAAYTVRVSELKQDTPIGQQPRIGIGLCFRKTSRADHRKRSELDP